MRSCCVDCGGFRRSCCVDCGGFQTCQLKKQRRQCKECTPASERDRNKSGMPRYVPAATFVALLKALHGEGVLKLEKDANTPTTTTLNDISGFRIQEGMLETSQARRRAWWMLGKDQQDYVLR